MIMEERACPRCGRTYTGYPSISRADNKTEICPDCGREEAMIAFGLACIKAQEELKNEIK